jgi:hypothetical protein
MRETGNAFKILVGTCVGCFVFKSSMVGSTYLLDKKAHWNAMVVKCGL